MTDSPCSRGGCVPSRFCALRHSAAPVPQSGTPACERTVRAGNSAAVCQRDTDTRRRATNPAVRREPPTSGPTALALSMSPVCAVASGRGGCKHSCRRGLLGLLLGSTRTRGRTLLYSQQLPNNCPRQLPWNPIKNRVWRPGSWAVVAVIEYLSLLVIPYNEQLPNYPVAKPYT